MTPPVSSIRQDDTHRLIPTRRGEAAALARLVEDLPEEQADDELEVLVELESASNDRLLGESDLLPGIGVHELVFGVPHAQIVNATFTHAHPTGSRFNTGDRGAWYAAFELKTSEVEVAFHKSEELQEIGWLEKETFVYDEYLADFRGEFHDLRGRAGSKSWLDPDSYAESQRLAVNLVAEGSSGIVYPSVRHTSGTCLVCFRPALVTHVRRGKTVTMTFRAGQRIR